MKCHECGKDLHGVWNKVNGEIYCSECALQKLKGDEYIERIHELKDTRWAIAQDLLLQYKALGLQYGRTIQDERQQEEYYILLGRRIQDFEERLNRAEE